MMTDPVTGASIILTNDYHSHGQPFVQRVITLTAGSTIFIGRASQDPRKERDARTDNAFFFCQVLTKDHASIYLVQDRVFIQDHNSRHGTFVNGTRLDAHRRQVLHVGDRIQLGMSLDLGETVHKCIHLRFGLVGHTASTTYPDQAHTATYSLQYSEDESDGIRTPSIDNEDGQVPGTGPFEIDVLTEPYYSESEDEDHGFDASDEENDVTVRTGSGSFESEPVVDARKSESSGNEKGTSSLPASYANGTSENDNTTGLPIKNLLNPVKIEGEVDAVEVGVPMPDDTMLHPVEPEDTRQPASSVTEDATGNAIPCLAPHSLAIDETTESQASTTNVGQKPTSISIADLVNPEPSAVVSTSLKRKADVLEDHTKELRETAALLKKARETLTTESRPDGPWSNDTPHDSSRNRPEKKRRAMLMTGLKMTACAMAGSVATFGFLLSPLAQRLAEM